MTEAVGVSQCKPLKLIPRAGCSIRTSGIMVRWAPVAKRCSQNVHLGECPVLRITDKASRKTTTAVPSNSN